MTATPCLAPAHPTRHPLALVGDTVTIVTRALRGRRSGVITETYQSGGRPIFVVALSPTRRAWLRREDFVIELPPDTARTSPADLDRSDKAVA